MSKENLDVVRALYESFGSFEGTTVRYDLIDPEIEIDFSERVFNPAVYHGHEGIERLGEEVGEVWDEWITEPEELIDVGDHVVVFVRTRGRGRGSGVEVESRHANLLTLRDGKVVRYRFYRDRDEAMRAAEQNMGSPPANT